MAAKQADQRKIPNHPDVDLIDEVTGYVIQVEVPGIKDVNNIKCQWTSSTQLIVTGDNTPPEKTEGTSGNATKEDKSTKDLWYHSGNHGLLEFAPRSIIAERRMGMFRRDFSFAPDTVDIEKMTAKLEGGLLSLVVPKRSHHIPKGNGTVKIEQVD